MEKDSVQKQIDYLNNRQTALEDRIPPLIEAAVKGYLAGHALTEDERRYVKEALKAQAQRAEMRQAIIEKSLGGLVWALIIGLGAAVWQYIKNEVRR